MPFSQYQFNYLVSEFPNYVIIRNTIDESKVEFRSKDRNTSIFNFPFIEITPLCDDYYMIFSYMGRLKNLDNKLNTYITVIIDQFDNLIETLKINL